MVSKQPKDPLYEEACEVARRMKYASTSLFTRRFRIGYAQAASILDQMEENKFCEPFNSYRRNPTRRKLTAQKAHLTTKGGDHE